MGGGEIEREGSLVDEGSTGEAEGSGSGLRGGDKRLSEVGVDKRGKRKRRRGLDTD